MSKGRHNAGELAHVGEESTKRDAVHLLSSGFVFDSVEVLVECIQQERDELMAVLLGVVAEPVTHTGHHFL